MGNISEGHGGGIYNLEFSSPTIINCIFQGNTANWGAGMTNTVDCDPTITGCVFESNTTYNVGGGIFNRSRSSPSISTRRSDRSSTPAAAASSAISHRGPAVST